MENKPSTSQVKTTSEQVSVPKPEPSSNQIKESSKSIPQLSVLKNQSSNVEKFLTGNPNF